MPIYRIPLEKEYQNKQGYVARVTVYGYLDVEAISATAAKTKYKTMLADCLQTVDERIVWDWEASGCSGYESLLAVGYRYVDWSFGISENKAIELVKEEEGEQEPEPVILIPELKSALVTVLQVIDKLNPRVMDWVLTEIDLNDDAWEEELNLLKAAVNWEDDEDEDEEDDDEED